MPFDPLNDLPPHDRRGFFRAGLGRLLRPVAGYIEKRLPAELLDARPLLRPPGALPETAFLDTCHRCGRCAEACPASAIALIASMDDRIDGTPHVVPSHQACVICDDLSCMKVCPSGALRLCAAHEIRMGLAVVDHETCLRSDGEDCTICVEQCPIGTDAIHVDDSGAVVVIDPTATGRGCTGCGVCEQQCPTRPTRAIFVQPTAR
jgi:ferredoxin-type protein NapG